MNDRTQRYFCSFAEPLTASLNSSSLTPPLPFVNRMRPPPRTTRLTNNPGTVDVPKTRRSPTEVAAEKTKKKETAITNAKKKSERMAQLARVEQEIKIAQKEAVRARGQGQIKRTFSRETLVDPVDEVPLSSPYLCRSTHIICSRTDTLSFGRQPLRNPFRR